MAPPDDDAADADAAAVEPVRSERVWVLALPRLEEEAEEVEEPCNKMRRPFCSTTCACDPRGLGLGLERGEAAAAAAAAVVGAKLNAPFWRERGLGLGPGKTPGPARGLDRGEARWCDETEPDVERGRGEGE
jgi:hypothetical protein